MNSTRLRGFLTLADGHTLELPGEDGLDPSWHVFSGAEISAINAALATGRPLLVRGEPGVGKSQLARAAAVALGRALVHQAVDSSTATHDLLWTFDAVARLAEAQVMGSLTAAGAAKLERTVAERLAVPRFIQPGALWWALNPRSAQEQAEVGGYGPCVVSASKRPVSDAGTVVLIDEIDKADPGVPNGLLDALGHRGFNVQGLGRVRADATSPPPLVVITTNEERTLPDAFLRRCLVLHLGLPEGAAGRARLLALGVVHFPGAEPALLEKAADLLLEDRASLRTRHMAPPGVAEYLDLVRAVVEQREDPGERRALLEEVRAFALRKHPMEPHL